MTTPHSYSSQHALICILPPPLFPPAILPQSAPFPQFPLWAIAMVKWLTLSLPHITADKQSQFRYSTSAQPSLLISYRQRISSVSDHVTDSRQAPVQKIIARVATRLGKTAKLRYVSPLPAKDTESPLGHSMEYPCG